MCESYRRSALSVGAFVLVLLVVGAVAPAGAQESDANPAPRDFGGHLFIPSTVVPDPFVSTSFMTTTGFGQAVNLVVPVFKLDGEKIGEISSNIGFMLLGFDYQHAVSRRVALRVAANGSGRIGTSAMSILAEGISALYGYGLGGSVNVARKRAWQLAATADLRGNTLYGVSPLGYVRSVVAAVAEGDTAGALTAAQDSLLSTGDNLRVLGGVRAAYTPAPWIGFTGLFEAGLGEKFRKDSDNVTVTNFGVTTSFDLNPLARVPVGLLGVFRNESLNEKNDDIGSSQAFGLGVFYTGRRFFSLGLENTWSQIHQSRTDKKIDAVMVRIIVRYDFQ
jgi:hypothetical protein